MSTQRRWSNLSILLPFLNFTPRTFLLSGLTSMEEVWGALGLWTGLRVVVVDPHLEKVQQQMAMGWPDVNSNSVLLHGIPGETTHYHQEPTPSILAWDDLEDEYGPFEDVILWQDLIIPNLPVIQGAWKLIERKEIRVINICYQHEESKKEERLISELLLNMGYTLGRCWWSSDDHQYYLYYRKNRRKKWV